MSPNRGSGAPEVSEPIHEKAETFILQSSMKDHNIFYVPAASIGGEEVTIKGSQLLHIKSVMRKRVGERVYITDGNGYHYEVEIASLSRSLMTAKILEKKRMPRKYDVEITLGFVPVKGLRNDLIIEKGTELGVVRFVLFPSGRSVVRNIGRQKTDRLMKIAQSSMTQSRQYYMPEIMFVESIDELFVKGPPYDRMYVAEPAGLITLPSEGKRILLLIGPEGGFTRSEIGFFVNRGVQTMGLGSARLRSETAAIVGVAKILAACGQI